jgi:hypothetical protein
MRLSFARTRAWHEWKVKELAFRAFARKENLRRYNREKGFIINPYSFGGAPTDPDFASVISLVHFDEAAGNTGPFADQIANRSPGWTRIAVGAQGSTTGKWANGLNAANVGVYNADHADWNFGSGDYTVEGWFQWLTTGSFEVLFAQWDSGSGNKAPFLCYKDSTEHLQFLASTTNASWDFAATSAATFSTSTWYFVQQLRSGTTAIGRVNGTAVVTNGTLTGSVVNNSNNVTLGNTSDNPTTLDLNGFIDDFRATKGVARGTTVPTAAFPNS